MHTEFFVKLVLNNILLVDRETSKCRETERERESFTYINFFNPHTKKIYAIVLFHG